MNSIVRINIALLPPPTVAAQARTISSLLENQGGFVLGEETSFPHVTLFMTDVPQKNIGAVESLLAKLQPLQKMMLVPQEVYCQKESGYIEIAFECTEDLQRLQYQIAESIIPLREGVSAHVSIYRNFTVPQQENIQKFGYPDMGDLFSPHITFTRTDSPVLQEVLSSLPVFDFSFVPEYLALSIAGEQGTCKKLITKFRI